jgi:hypothetical protein
MAKPLRVGVRVRFARCLDMDPKPGIHVHARPQVAGSLDLKPPLPC